MCTCPCPLMLSTCPLRKACLETMLTALIPPPSTASPTWNCTYTHTTQTQLNFTSVEQTYSIKNNYTHLVRYNIYCTYRPLFQPDSMHERCVGTPWQTFVCKILYITHRVSFLEDDPVINETSGSVGQLRRQWRTAGERRE